MTLRPMVSVIIPVYNGSNYLDEAIRSAVSQDYDSKEILVVNDGSNDDGSTEKIALSYGNRIRYLKKKNGGVASALNMGIKNAGGEYVCWLSHDDVFPRGRISEQVGFLNRNHGLDPERTILYGDVEWIDSRSRSHRVIHFPMVPPSKFYSALLSGVYFTSPWRYGIFGLNGCTTFIPIKAFDEMGMFNEDLRTTQDRDMWFRMNREYDFIHIPKVLVRSRVHPEMATIRMKERMVNEVDVTALKALAMYDRGSEKFDFVSSQVAFGLKRDPRKVRSYQEIMKIVMNEERGGRDVLALLLTFMHNKVFKFFEDKFIL